MAENEHTSLSGDLKGRAARGSGQTSNIQRYTCATYLGARDSEMACFHGTRLRLALKIRFLNHILTN